MISKKEQVDMKTRAWKLTFTKKISVPEEETKEIVQQLVGQQKKTVFNCRVQSMINEQTHSCLTNSGVSFEF